MTDFSGHRILVVEDEALIAMDLTAALEGRGAEVVGPAADIGHAIALLGDTAISGAVLDINLNGEMAYPVADILARRDTPFVFATAYGQFELPTRFANIRRIEKPYEASAIVRALEIAMAAR